MWLVLAPAADAAAEWACRGLRARGLAPVELVRAETLVRSTRWVHRLGAAGESVELELPDGQAIRSEDVHGVLNRIGYVPLEALGGAGGDREYVVQELHAFFMSWLNALRGTVIGRPTPQGLCGRWRHLSEWALLAQRAGLATPPYRQRTRDGDGAGRISLAPPGAAVCTAIVVGGSVAGAAPPLHVASACRRLAAGAGGELLGIDLYVDAYGRWSFAAATPVPDLRIGGEPLLDALAAALRGRRPVAA